MGSLVEDLDANARPASPLKAALHAPYDLERWSQDLRRLGAGAPTGFDALEDVGMRWVAGKLYAVVARPGGGKTGFMLEAAARALEADPNAQAVFLSWEEPLAELVVRLFLRADALNEQRARKGFGLRPIPRPVVRAWGCGELVDPETRARLEAVRGDVADLLERLLLIDGDTLGRDVHPVLRHVGAWMRREQKRPALVVVDYFQKLRGGGFYPTTQAELKAVADALRRFAKGELIAAVGEEDNAPTSGEDGWAVPVLVGAQVNRADLADTHPSGDNIREADDLLNDAAAVVALSYIEAGENRTLRLSVPKHRDGRARRDTVASLSWDPARAWLDRAAHKDGGRVAWTSYKDAPDAPRGKATGKLRTLD